MQKGLRLLKVIKECQVCGAKYEACTFCEQQNHFLAWRSVVCTPEHFVYHIPIISYIRKQITKEEARNDLLAAEKEYGEIEYADNIKDIVAEIKAVEAPKKSAKRTKKSKSVDEKTVCDSQDIIE